MRTFGIALCVLTLAAGCDRPVGTKGSKPDFANERKNHPTKLLTHGPSPQPYELERPPAGVREVAFSSGALKLNAWISNPAADGKVHPAVVYCHGGFSFGADDWAQSKPYRDAGFIVMMPMLRGENGNPGEFEMFYGEVDDVIAAGEYLAALQGVDKNRVFIAGHSAGGTIAALASLLPSPFVAAASFGGTMDAEEFLASPDWRSIAPFNPNDRTEVRLRSSKPFLIEIRCPLLLVSGSEEDYLAPRIRSLQDQKLKTENELSVAIVPGDHFSAVDESIRRSIAFFKRVAR